MLWHRSLLLLTLLLPRLAAALPSYITFPADIDWVTRDSEHFQVIYRRGEDDFGERVLCDAERAYRLLTPIFPPGPPKTMILLSDFSDSTNGYSVDLPWPHIVLFAVPPDPASELSWLDDWLFSLVLHEYVHTLHIYPANSFWKPLRSILGSWILPNGLLPRHLHEGVAVLLETNQTEGGRGRGPYFRMGRRMMVDADDWSLEKHPLDRMDDTPSLWPGGNGAYYYGYLLYDELWRRKGAQGIHDLTDAYSRNLPYFFQDRPLEKVYGTDYTTVWNDIFKRTTAEEKEEIEEIRKKPLSSLDYLTNTHFGKHDVTLSPDGKQVVYRKWTPEEGGVFERFDLASGKAVDQARLHAGGVNGMCWGKTAQGERFLFLKDVEKDLYHTNQLGAYDWATKQSATLNDKDGKPLEHLRLLACSPDLSRLLVYREHAGKGEAIALKWDGGIEEEGLKVKEEKRWDLPTGSWISGLVAGSPDWIALREGMTTTLYRWETGAPTYALRLKTHAYNLRPGRRPGELYAIASLDGRDEIWAIDTEKKTTRKVVALLGGTNSFAATQDDFILSSFRDGGYDIARAGRVESQPETRYVLRDLPSTVTSDAPPSLSGVQDYSPLGTLVPRMWVPNLLIVPEGLQVGAYIPGFDVAQRHLYEAFLGFDTRGQPFAIADYTYRFNNQISLVGAANYLPTYVYDPYNTFLKTWGGGVSVNLDLSPYLPTISVGPVFGRKEGSAFFGPANQAVGVGIGLQKDIGIQSRPLDPAPRLGTRLSLLHVQNFTAMGSNDNFFTTTAGVDQCLPAPWADGHSFYIGLRGGLTEGTMIYNSYFSAGGDLLFYQYRSYFLNRGFQYLAFPFSRRIVNLNLEYRFPLWHVERGIGLWPAFLNQIHMAILSDTSTRDLGPRNPGDPAYDPTSKIFNIYYESVGAEIKTEWTFSYYLPGTITLGFYHGFGPYGEGFNFSLGIEAAI